MGALARELCRSDIHDISSLKDPSVSSLRYQITTHSGLAFSRFDGAALGQVDVVRYETLGKCHLSRTQRHLRSDHLDDFLFCVTLQAGADFSWSHGSSATMGPDQFVIYPASKPVAATLFDVQPDGKASCFHLRVARSELMHRVPHIEDCYNIPVAIRSGPTRIMKAMLEVAVRESCGLTESQSYQFGSMVLDSIANATIEAPELNERVRRSSSNGLQDRFDKALRHIDAHLANPGLNAESVAAACGLSVRQLRLAFASKATTVNAFIRERRLDRCRDALLSPTLGHRSTFRVALEWGFNDPAHFSRVYRARYGHSPHEDRPHKS